MHRSRRRIAAIIRRSDINPKVFISHASEDKERFLRAFADDIRTDDETLGSADESPLSYTIQIRGFEEYARAFVEDY